MAKIIYYGLCDQFLFILVKFHVTLHDILGTIPYKYQAVTGIIVSVFNCLLLKQAIKGIMKCEGHQEFHL